MPQDASGSGEAREGREPGRLDDWQRIEAEKAQRDAVRRKYDAEHDPSPEFEKAARPLGPEYGRERPRDREIPAEVAAAFGRTPEQLQVLREKMFAEMDARAERWAARESSVSDSAVPAGGVDEGSSSEERVEVIRPSEDPEQRPRMTLDAKVGADGDAPTAREVLDRYAGPEGLTVEQRRADEAYVAEYGERRPWLRIASDEDGLVRHVYCERDRAGGHDPARHDGWRDAAGQEQRASAGKDPAHPVDSPAYHGSVDHLQGATPPDGIGGRGKQHRPGDHVTWISDPTAWAVATARAVGHPDVRRAYASENPPPNVKVALEDVLGPDGHRYCDGYALVTDGFASSFEAKDNRDQWVARVRNVMKKQGVDRDQAERHVEMQSVSGEIKAVKPEVKRIDTFEGGTVQVNLKVRDGVATGVSTICYNPPANESKQSKESL